MTRWIRSSYSLYRVDEMDLIAWSKRAYTLDELYSHRFPLIVQVVRGHCGSEDTDSLGMGQIVRIHRKQRQKRVIAVEERRGRRISIPRDYNVPLELLPVKRGTIARKLDDILCDHELPLKVQFSRQVKLNYYVDNEVMIDEDFGSMRIEYIYDEIYLQGNAINFYVLDNDIIDIPSYLRLEFSIAEGLIGDEDQSSFRALCERLDAVVETKINYNQATGNQNIAVYYQRKGSNNLNITSTMPDKTLSVRIRDPNVVETLADVHASNNNIEIPHLETIIDGSWADDSDNEESHFVEYIPKHFNNPRPTYMQDNIVFMSDSKLQIGSENFKRKQKNGNSRSPSTSTTSSSASSLASANSKTASDEKISYKKANRRLSIPSRFKSESKLDVLPVDVLDSPHIEAPYTTASNEPKPVDEEYPNLFKSSTLMKVNAGAFRVDTSKCKESNEGVFTPRPTYTEYEVNDKGKKVKIKKKKEKTKQKERKEKRISKIQDLPKSLELLNVNQVIDMLTLLKLGSYSPNVAIEGIDGAKLKTMRAAEYETKLGMSPQDANKLATFCINTF